jgi:negative regulator of replication initiation
LSQDAQKVMSSGVGVHVRQVQGTPYWLMTTIDNDHKRQVVAEALQFLGYPAETAAEILAGLPESRPRVKPPPV